VKVPSFAEGPSAVAQPLPGRSLLTYFGCQVSGIRRSGTGIEFQDRSFGSAITRPSRRPYVPTEKLMCGNRATGSDGACAKDVKILGTNYASLLESAKASKNELKTNWILHAKTPIIVQETARIVTIAGVCADGVWESQVNSNTCFKQVFEFGRNHPTLPTCGVGVKNENKPRISMKTKHNDKKSRS